MIFFIIWLVLTVGISAYCLHEMGKMYGAHVSTSSSMRFVVFATNGTSIWIVMAFIEWLFS